MRGERKMLIRDRCVWVCVRLGVCACACVCLLLGVSLSVASPRAPVTTQEAQAAVEPADGLRPARQGTLNVPGAGPSLARKYRARAPVSCVGLFSCVLLRSYD